MEVAALGLKADSSQIREATIALKELPPAATAAERAAQRWGVATTNAGRSAEDFSRRVQGTIRQLEFERQQLTRNAAEQQKFAALRRAGVTASSAEGQAIAAAVAALQAQKAANEQAAKASGVQIITTRAAGTAWRGILGVLGPLTAAMSAAAVATKIWDTAMEVADFGEKADQIGLTVKAMQALQFAAVQNGLGIEQLENGVAKFSQKIGEAADGSKEMIEALDKIGVKILDVSGALRPTEDLLFEVAQKIMAIDDPARRAAAAVDFFGKAGVKMLPLLAEMAKGQDAVASSAERAGAMISGDVIATLDKFSDRLSRAALTSRAFFANIAADIIDWGNRVEAWWDKVSPNDPASVKKRQDAWRIPFEDFFDWLGDSFADIIAKAVGWSAGFAAAFKELGPMLKKVFGEAMNDMLGVIEKGLNMAQQALSNAKGWFKTQGPIDPITIGRLKPGEGGSFSAIGQAASDAEAAARAGMPNSAAIRAQSRAAAGMGNYGEDMAAGGAAGPRAAAVLPGGATNPGIKGGGSDPYAKTIESAREYILTKKAEIGAIGQTVLAAAQLKHEQELLNKATGEGKTLSEAQKAALKDLAGQMAEADNSLAKAKFIDDAKTRSEEFLAQQQLERDSLFLSAEAANRLKLETEMLNAAKRQGIELSPTEVESIRATAEAMAASQEHTRRLSEQVGLAKDVTKGFFSDVSQGLREGASVWEAFGTAAENALNRIIDKLLEMAVDDLFNAAFGGGKSGGGGGGIFGSIFGGSGGGGGIFDGILNMFGFANGAAFRNGALIPFANGAALLNGAEQRFAAGGAIVNRPTTFPMAGGRRGLMGEAGPEAILPLHRGRDGGLGVRMTGVRGGADSQQRQAVNITVTGDTDLVRVTARDEFDRSIAVAGTRIENRAVKRANAQAPSVVANHENITGGEYRFGRD